MIFKMFWLEHQTLDWGFESCSFRVKLWTSLFTPHCSSSLSYRNEYLAIEVVDICVQNV